MLKVRVREEENLLEIKMEGHADYAEAAGNRKSKNYGLGNGRIREMQNGNNGLGQRDRSSIRNNF